MTNSVNEILDEDLLFVIGSNTTEAHPVIGIKMKQAVRRGTKLIVVDPRRTELAGMAHLWLPLRSGTDIALINGMMRIIVKDYISCLPFRVLAAKIVAAQSEIGEL